MPCTVEGGDDSLRVFSDFPDLKAYMYPIYSISPEDGENLSLGVWIGFSD